MLLTFILLASFTLCVNSHAIHQDTRCNCICPDPSIAQSESISAIDNLQNDAAEHIGARRSIYINSSVSPDDCDCQKVVLIHLNLTDAQADSFCPRCLCKYQTRSLAIIKVVVILVVWVVLLLLFYMAFLSILEPILSKKRCAGLPGLDRDRTVSYREHHDATESDDGSSTGPTDASGQEMNAFGGEGIVNRLGSQTSKWKRQVQEQRRNIYDRHAMLN